MGPGFCAVCFDVVDGPVAVWNEEEPDTLSVAAVLDEEPGSLSVAADLNEEEPDASFKEVDEHVG